MSKTRVLLSMESPLISQSMKKVFEEEADIEVVAEITDLVDVLAAIGRYDVDVLVHSWGDSPQGQALCSHVFSEYPNILVIGVNSGDDVGYAYRQINSVENLFSLIRSMRSQTQFV